MTVQTDLCLTDFVVNPEDAFSHFAVYFSIKSVPSVTALKYRGGLQLGVGMSTGHVSVNDNLDAYPVHK